MAGRVYGFGRKSPVGSTADAADLKEQQNVRHVDVEVSSRLVDEVVDQALKDVPESDAEAIKYLWARDPNNALAKAYFDQEVKLRTTSTFAQLNKREVNIDEVLTSDETAKLIEYAAEYDLNFRQTTSHDHAFHSARRKIDMMKMQSNLPAAMEYMDIGGSVTHHVSAGNTHVLVVAPFDVDQKDPQRKRLTEMRLRRIHADPDFDPTSRRMAASVLAGEGRYHIAGNARTIDVKGFKNSMSCHVYDVSILDWARMMDRCYLQIHEGCIHWSDEFLYRQQGTLPYSGSYFEVDAKQDKFRMRIGESQSAWYEHRWSQLMQYAASQVVAVNGSNYAYEIVERKQDTIFFRIMRVGALAKPNKSQVYRLPDLKMVHVHGFEVKPGDSRKAVGKRNRLINRTYVWPEDLWNLLLRYAMSETLRGGFSYDKAYNYYRTVVPAHSVLGVHIRGGQHVSVDELPALVVMSAIVAHEEIMTSKRSVRYQTEFIQNQRTLRHGWTLVKFVELFWESLKGLVLLPFMPLAFLPPNITYHFDRWMTGVSVTWRPRVETRGLNMALIVDTKLLDFDVMTPLQIDYRQELSEDGLTAMLDVMRTDPDHAQLLLDSCGDSLPHGFQQELRSVTGHRIEELPDQSSVGSSTAVDAGTSYFMKGDKKIQRGQLARHNVKDTVSHRRLAVDEAIQECQAEMDACTFTCARIYREVVGSDRVRTEILVKRKEELYNADVWLVKDGLLVKSVVHENAKFDYGGVYVPRADATGVFIQPVYEDNWSGYDAGTGQHVYREYLRMPFNYTGYALVIDDLRIYNGPRIVDTLRRVMSFSDDDFAFKVVAHQGPAGCGKTTTIVNDGDPRRDAFLAPGRLSISDMREKLVKHHKVDKRAVDTVARTLDSFLVNYDRLPARAKQGFRSLLFDEYVLARSGKIIAAVVLLGMAEVHVYGDRHQIHHIPRTTVPNLYSDMQPQVVEEEYLTYRCAPRILAAVADVYDYRVRSMQQAREDGEVIAVKSFERIRWMKDVMVLTFYQAEKKVVAKMLPSDMSHVKISTVHEAQGLAADQIVLFNSEVRSRPLDDPSGYLANKTEYCLVAITRARFSFVYWKPALSADKVMAMVERAKDNRRVAACKDVSSQGERKEFI